MNIYTALLPQKARNMILRVRELNDQFRRDIHNEKLGKIRITECVAALKDGDIRNIISEVQCFEDFNEGNDPYGEHDFGKVGYNHENYFFKIDYYAKGSDEHSKDKSNPRKTLRVITIMHTSEY